ncbi:MAG: sulfatase-like hydrolase/transferase [Chloroflexota bacterium]
MEPQPVPLPVDDLRKPGRAKTWGNLFAVSVLVSQFYVFMEWLFFVTKESSLSSLSLWKALEVLLVTAGILSILVVAALGILLGLGILARPLRGERFFQAIGMLVPAAVLAVTGLIMADNFTYTVFGFGVVTTHGLWRLAYAFGFAVAFAFAYRFVWTRAAAGSRKRKKAARLRNGLALGLVAVSTIAIASTVLVQREYYSRLLDTYAARPAKRPNILILGSDGLSSTHLSLYGYERDTTPFLRGLAGSSLVTLNAFPNASSTTASTTSVLTGKPPVVAGVMRYPDILEEEHAFEHLPGILQEFGYTTVEVGVPYWVDAKSVNLLDGFDSVNGEPLDDPALSSLRRLFGDSQAPYFIWTLSKRASDRLLDIFLVREMENPIEAVTDPRSRMSDEERMERIISLLEKSNTPLFVFAHFMDTHGPTFSPREQVYSQGDSATHPWSDNFYDDAITGFDHYVEQIYTRLEESGLLENTIIVIYTDHAEKYVTNVRTPLLIRFPEGEHAGTIEHNAQNLDIPVTILDYMGLARPDWMTGHSLLDGEPPADREIWSIVAGAPKNVVAPFYQIKIVQVIVCQKWFQLNVQKNESYEGTVNSYEYFSPACAKEQIPDEEAARQKIIEYLEAHGYDASSLTE